MSKAQRLFELFHGREPTRAETVFLDSIPPQELALVGTLDGVIYTAASDRRKYVHRFAKGNTRRPLLTVADDGKQIYVLGGTYVFGQRGFVG